MRLLVLLMVAVAGSRAVFRKCCPAGQQLSVDLRTCTPLRHTHGTTKDHNYYSTDPDGGGGGAHAGDRARRGAEDWGWMPPDAVITDSASLEVVTLDDLRRAVSHCQHLNNVWK